MRKKLAIVMAILVGCGVCCFAQGQVTRPTTTPVKQSVKISDPDGYMNGHGYVNLGLSVKWATCNVGATSYWDYGDHFAWGETTAKKEYTDDNSNTYGKSVSELKSEGIINSAGNLTRDYDTASANWGASWRLPTKAEFDELVSKCTWTWDTQNGKTGYKVTGPNGKSIFVPAAGDRLGASLEDAGDDGLYWSSTVYDGANNAYGLYFSKSSQHTGRYYRDYGFSVRPVSE